MERPHFPTVADEQALAPDTTPEVCLDAIPEEESLVADARGCLTPAQMVERKLISLLRGAPLPPSELLTHSRPVRSGE